ncbi:NADPH-dependent ferric siderophore reductase [Amycolatopsis antarctica]|uniref:NADPH-dependent ferric siderophore reductase n=1 Tax=Amycolatopsis antarctica TaxID=1854586 RepID=A0A263CYG3_9PSEU|nr:NADPH-dependent ferric siderophore reductase [Amycolatopsis antarctica]
MSATRVKPESSELLTLAVVRRERISPHFTRVTLGGGDAERFRHMGFDQWFRLFIPVGEDSLSRLPAKLNLVAYARYLAIAKTSRPVLRNYTVRAYRADGPGGPELDVDFVLHGSAADGTAGPAASWAQDCGVGDTVAILDEGIGFHPPGETRQVLLVADESALPAAAGILASLPPGTTGRAVIEIPSGEDRQDILTPSGVEVDWVVREDAHAVPGRAALAAATALPVPRDGCAWVAGESALPVALRGYWVAGGMPKADIMFCGYWKSSH